MTQQYVLFYKLEPEFGDLNWKINNKLLGPIDFPLGRFVSFREYIASLHKYFTLEKINSFYMSNRGWFKEFPINDWLYSTSSVIDVFQPSMLKHFLGHGQVSIKIFDYPSTSDFYNEVFKVNLPFIATDVVGLITLYFPYKHSIDFVNELTRATTNSLLQTTRRKF